MSTPSLIMRWPGSRRWRAGASWTNSPREEAALGGRVAAAESARPRSAGWRQSSPGCGPSWSTWAEQLVDAAGRRAWAEASWRRASRSWLSCAGSWRLAARPFACVADKHAAVERAVRADQALAAAFDVLAATLDAEDRARRRAEDEALASGFGPARLAPSKAAAGRAAVAVG